MDKSQVEIPGISRREFLTYAWLGSIGLLMAQGAGLLLKYTLPHEHRNVFGGIFNLEPTIPESEFTPIYHPDGKFWLASYAGFVALYQICPFEKVGQKYKWVEANTRFECPNCGSKFQLNGQWITGAAPRNLDRFPIQIFTSDGIFKSNKYGDPVMVNPETIEKIEVDTSKLIQGQNRRSYRSY